MQVTVSFQNVASCATGCEADNNSAATIIIITDYDDTNDDSPRAIVDYISAWTTRSLTYTLYNKICDNRYNNNTQIRLRFPTTDKHT